MVRKERPATHFVGSAAVILVAAAYDGNVEVTAGLMTTLPAPRHELAVAEVAI